jgi:hypothetical protein
MAGFRMRSLSTGTVVALAAEAVALAGLLAVAADQWAHKRVENLAGVNTWGYRGPVLRVKQPREARLVVVGGDQAFGWGLAPAQTMAAYLRRMVEGGLREPRESSGRPVTAATIAALGLPAREYATRIQRFADLQPDVVVLYPDLTPTPAARALPSRSSAADRPASALAVADPSASWAAVMPPADSFITSRTGYVPMLPLLLEEKGDVLAGSGWRAGLLVGSTGRGLRELDRRLYRATRRPPANAASEDRSTSVGRAIDAGLAVARAVAVVLPVPRSEAERDEHARLRGMVERLAAREPRAALADLAAHAELADAALLIGGDRYGAQGQQLAAGVVAPVVIDLLQRERVR